MNKKRNLIITVNITLIIVWIICIVLGSLIIDHYNSIGFENMPNKWTYQHWYLLLGLLMTILGSFYFIINSLWVTQFINDAIDSKQSKENEEDTKKFSEQIMSIKGVSNE